MAIDYSAILTCNALPAFLVTTTIVGQDTFYLVAVGNPLTVAPFDVDGLPVDWTGQGYPLSGFPIISTPVTATKSLYVAQWSGVQNIQQKQDIRDTYDILKAKPEGIIKLDITETDGIPTAATATVLDVQQFLDNPYYG